MEDNDSRAHRLAYTLYQFSEDPRSVNKLAYILNYLPDGLQKDMLAIYMYIGELEYKIKKLEDR